MRTNPLYGQWGRSGAPAWLEATVASALAAGANPDSAPADLQAQLQLDSLYRARVLLGEIRRRAGDPRGFHPSERDTVVEAPEGDDGTDGHEYFVNELTGEYRFLIRGRPQALILPKAQVDQMVRDYVKDGGGYTQAELARAHRLVRAEVNAILKALGIVKGSPPFTPEALAELPEEELHERWLAAKVHRVERKAQAAIWREIERDALKYRDIARSVLSYMADAVNEQALAPWPAPLPPLAHDGRRRALFIVATDWHIGRAAWVGYGPNGFDIHECERRIDQAVSRTLAELKHPVERIFLTVGGDLAHADGMSRTTTKGTPQDMGISSAEMIVRTVRIMFRLIHRLVATAPVTLCQHAGNHDQALDIGLYAALTEAFRDHPHVETAGDPAHPYSPYQRVRYGNTLVGLTHGDKKWKAADLAPIMVNRWPVDFTETKHHIWCLGHRHSLIVEDTKGVQVWSMPSITGSDEWHEGSWPHHSPPRLGSHLLDYEWGPVGVIYAHVDQGLDDAA